MKIKYTISDFISKSFSLRRDKWERREVGRDIFILDKSQQTNQMSIAGDRPDHFDVGPFV